MANEGYAKIATLMSHHGELAIFRRFTKLNYQNLLYLQAELTHLEASINALAIRDATSPGRSAYSSHWWHLAQSEESHDDNEQWEKALQIRDKLNEYNRCMKQAVFLSKLRPPNSYNMNFFRNWLKRPKMGNFPLDGPDHDSWAVEKKHDLLAIQLQDHEHNDALSLWISHSLIPCFHNLIGKRFIAPIPIDPQSEISHYPEKPLRRGMKIFVTVLASLIPVTSIIILYFVVDTLSRLGICAAFTGIFALCLSLTTRARSIEIFAATSAFAAVQVVFVTGNGSRTS